MDLPGTLSPVVPPVFAGGESTVRHLISTALHATKVQKREYVTYHSRVLEDSFGVVYYTQKDPDHQIDPAMYLLARTYA